GVLTVLSDVIVFDERADGIVAADEIAQRMARRPQAAIRQTIDQSFRAQANIRARIQIAHANVSRFAFGPPIKNSESAVNVADNVLHITAVARIHREIAEDFAVENRLVARRYRRIRLPQ